MISRSSKSGQLRIRSSDEQRLEDEVVLKMKYFSS